MKAPIKGSGQPLKVFEERVKYLSSSELETDTDGYVRGNLKDKGYIDVCLVPVNSKEYNIQDYGEDFTGMSNMIIRNYEQTDSTGRDILITINDEYENYHDFDRVIILRTGDYIVRDGIKWKILRINNYDEVVKCLCGRMKEGDYPVV